MTFIYFEDRNVETGHGWRDLDPKRLEIVLWPNKDDDIKLQLKEAPYGFIYATCSYFWIVRKDDQEGFYLRTGDIKEVHPGFLGNDDMESHFEFSGMTPPEVIRHLEALRITNGNKLGDK